MADQLRMGNGGERKSGRGETNVTGKSVYRAGKRTEKGGKPGGVMTLARGILLSLLLWALGTLSLAWCVAIGMAGTEKSFPLLAGFAAVSAYLGAMDTARNHPWAPLPPAMAAGGVFALLLLILSLLLWKRVAWHGGILAVCCLTGGALAGLSAGWRGKKRKRRVW